VSVERYIRFVHEGGARWGRRREGDVVEILSGAPWRDDCAATQQRIRVETAQLLAPAEPTKILALAYNFKDLFADPAARATAREAHYSDPGFEPLLFLKGPNSLAGPNQTIEIPPYHEVWVEVEVTAIIGRRVRNLRGAEEARAAVFGLTIGNDVTALNVLGRDWHLARSKALDHFCPLGPELVRNVDDHDLKLSTAINGRTTQSSTTANRVLDTYQAVALASRIMTLEPGDALLTGTPAGARQSLVRGGDIVTLQIEGLGSLSNTIKESAS